MLRRLAFAVLVAVVLSACDATDPDPAPQQTVVAAFLEAGGSMPEIRLTQTVDLGAVYSEETAAVTDATVLVELLGATGGVEQTIPYVHDQLSRYLPANGLTQVLPGRTYRLRATTPDTVLTATTTVPPTFDVVEAPPDEVVYQEDPRGPALRITLPPTPGRQSVYVATTRSLAPDEFEEILEDGETRYRSLNLPDRFRPVPLVARFAGCDEVGTRLICDDDPNSIYTSGTSPIINEASYEQQGDGTATVRVPWIAFGFFGPAEVGLISLDQAFQDFVQTQSLQQAPTTISPGEIPNVTTNVVGGLGVFGSYARILVRTTITEE